jgi:choice-of-anchor A domain-containing protein
MFGPKAIKNLHGTESAIHIKLVVGNRGAAVIIKGAKSTLICHAAVVVFLAMRSDCIALPVDLGVAGPKYWTVLETGTGTVIQSQSGRGRHRASGPTASSSYSLASASGSSQLAQARLDAAAASETATALSPTSTLNQINLRRHSLTLASGVYNLSRFQLTRSTLTLSGSGSFVFNISSFFALNSARVLLAGGATEANVLFNYTGTSDVRFSGRRSGSVLRGIILALNARVNLAPGLVVGEIISGKDILLSSGSTITNPNLTARVSVPEGTSTLALSLIALVALIAYRSLAARLPSKRIQPFQ